MKKTTTGKQNKADQTGGKDPKTTGTKTGSKKTKKEPRVLLDVSKYPKDDKGNAIVPDELMETEYRNLPDGTRNESGTFRAYHGGKMRSLGGNTERDHDIRVQGGKALQANLQQRKTLAESIEIALRKKASADDIDKYGLPADATNQDVITAAIVRQAGGGNMKAWTALRDTVGEMPVSKQEITADVMTAADRALVEKLSRRLDGQ